ncbi:MAG: hypothetical protein NT118_09600, partial [Lentisphaerae bacterium]|nr:hypothetical protein [Lentisphaerota bacterium]
LPFDYSIGNSTQVGGTLSQNEYGDLALHLLWCNVGRNAGGGYPAVEAPGSVELAVELAVPAPPKQITLEPSGRKLDYEFDGKRIRLKFQLTEIHAVVAVKL